MFFAAEWIGRPRFSTKPEQWSFIRHLMSTWCFLANNEQSFLVEAVEKLHMNQVVSEQCVEILQMAVQRIQEAGERQVQHALLLVNSKLLSLFSNRNAVELQSLDILCIILLVRTLFPNNNRLEDLFAHSYRQSDDASSRYHQGYVGALHRVRYDTAVEGFTTGDETENDEYFSAPEKTPANGSPSLRYDVEKSTESTEAPTEYPEVSESFVTPTTSPTFNKEMRFLRREAGSSLTIQEEMESLSQPAQGDAGLESTDESKSYSGNQSDERPGSQEIKATGPQCNKSGWKLPAFDKETLVQTINKKRERSYTYGEVEEKIGVKVAETGGEPAGRGRSRSLVDEDKKPESQLCSKNSASDSHLATSPRVEEADQPVKQPTNDYLKHGVFLSTNLCKFSPYQIHCRRIYPGIILVVLTEMPKISQAPRLVQLLQLLKDLLCGARDKVSPSQGQIIYDTINTQIIKTVVSLRKAKGPIHQLCSEIKKKWDEEKVREGIMQYLIQNPHQDMSASLERSLKFLYSRLREIFLVLYLPPSPLSPMATRVSSAMTLAAELFIERLGDYKEYLIVKAQRNITMTTYIEEFPGLVHFIYVNRRTNQLMAPSLNITNSPDDVHSLDATQLLKEKIWRMMNWSQRKLHEGYFTVMAREGDYFYSYFLWFENNITGAPEVIQKPYRPDSTAPPPGILTGNFYKYLIHKCFPSVVTTGVHCNELFMMHVGLVNSQYVAAHCRQMAAKLSETSGDVLGNISLFGT